MAGKNNWTARNADSIFIAWWTRRHRRCCGEILRTGAADPELQPFFTQTNMTWLKCAKPVHRAALGGPAEYKGKAMKPATPN